MKLIYNSTEDHKYIRRFTHDFLQSRKGEIISGMKARQLCNEIYGIDIDHHEWAYTLDYMHRIDEVEHYSCNSGNTQYFIKVK